jgi:hypothetical protein
MDDDDENIAAEEEKECVWIVRTFLSRYTIMLWVLKKQITTTFNYSLTCYINKYHNQYNMSDDEQLNLNGMWSIFSLCLDFNDFAARGTTDVERYKK